jgi:hypothetical protein
MTAAADTARAEADEWMFIATIADLLVSGWEGVAPTEAAVTGFDPSIDLDRRARAWGHELSEGTLVEIARFSAALATAEAEAWDNDDPTIATRAVEDRRFLLGDRMLHWSVPWLVTVGSTTTEWAPEAMAAVERLLELADRYRVAPALTDLEGTVQPGHDSFGPVPDGLVVDSIAGGWLFVDPATQVGPEPYEAAAGLWEELAQRHPGSARLWLDLAARARSSAARLAGG